MDKIDSLILLIPVKRYLQPTGLRLWSRTDHFVDVTLAPIPVL